MKLGSVVVFIHVRLKLCYQNVCIGHLSLHFIEM